MKPLYWPVVLDLVGIAIALLYGVGADSGGATTEGVFMILWATGWLTIILASVVLVRSIARKEAGAGAILLLLIVSAIAFLQTRLVISDSMALRSLFS